MKKLIYFSTHKDFILEEGDYKDYHFIIRNLGTHPCAYVESKFPHNDDIDVHGGITYRGTYHWGNGKYSPNYQKYYIGWDYAHCEDWDGSNSDSINIKFGTHKYTTEEIFEDVKSAIEQLINSKEETHG